MKVNHIVQVSAYYPPHLGGQENAVHDLARELAKAGRRVTVLTSNKGANSRGLTKENGVHVHRLWGVVFGHAPIMPWFPFALMRHTKACGIIHLHIGQAFTPEMVWLVAKLKRLKYIAQLHIDFEPSGPAGFLLPLYKRLLLKRVLRAASAVVTLNKKTARIVRDTYGYKGTIHVMNNGIDETYFNLKRQPFAPKPPKILRLLFVGRLSKQKNIATLLQALQLTNRKVHLDIIGDGEERQTIHEAIRTYGLTNVTMHGRLSRKDVLRFYETSDALIMPSLYEAQPLVLLEAMAARLPIIGTNVLGVADHIKNIGVIVEPTAKDLAAGIEQYDTHYALLPHMVEQGGVGMEKLRWHHTRKKYEALYETAMGN